METLKIREEVDDQRQMTLTVEVPEERVQKEMRLKARQLGREVRMPGFRRGKVPYRVLLKRLGVETVRAETVDDMVQQLYTEAVEQVDVEVFAQPTLLDIALEPLVVEFSVPLQPLVTLGDYRAMRREIEDVQVTEEAIDEALEQVQSRHAETEEVDRPVAADDLVVVDGQGLLTPLAPTESETDDEDSQPAVEEPTPIFTWNNQQIILDSNKLFAGTPFVDNLVGAGVGEAREFAIVFPEDFEDDELAGREVRFNVTVLNVSERHVPELDDSFAQLEGDFASLEELREHIRTDLQRQAEDSFQRTLIEETIDDMAKEAEFLYPPVAVELEIDDMVAALKNQISQGDWEFDDYLKMSGTSEEQLREDFRENAEQRLKNNLTFREFVLAEKIRITAEDVDAELDKRLGDFDNEELRDSLRQYYTSGAGFESISGEIVTDKAFERMVAIFSGTAPSIEELEAELEADEAQQEEE